MSTAPTVVSSSVADASPIANKSKRCWSALHSQRPQCRLAVLDLYQTIDLEETQVRHGLAHGGPPHEPRDVVPGTGPLHMLRHVPGGTRPLPQNGDVLAETLPVVLAQLLQTGVQVVEAILVGRQHLAHLVGLELVQRGEVVT